MSFQVSRVTHKVKKENSFGKKTVIIQIDHISPV